jgi:hypothetical protein
MELPSGLSSTKAVQKTWMGLGVVQGLNIFHAGFLRQLRRAGGFVINLETVVPTGSEVGGGHYYF